MAKHDPGDDMFNVVCGDLGLGQTTRSSIYLNYHNSLTERELFEKARNKKALKDVVVQHHDHGSKLFKQKANSDAHSKAKSKTSNKSNGRLKNKQSALPNGGTHDNIDMNIFPTYAEIPLGTSLRQHKQLYEQQVGDLRRQLSNNQPGEEEIGELLVGYYYLVCMKM